jgi:hypothetical protein
MKMVRLTFLKILAFGLLTGCADTQPLVLNANNPASPAAREAITSPAQAVLSLDQASKRTRELIAARAAQDAKVQHQQQQQNVSGMKNMPAMQPEEDNTQHEGDHDHQ